MVVDQEDVSRLGPHLDGRRGLQERPKAPKPRVALLGKRGVGEHEAAASEGAPWHRRSRRRRTGAARNLEEGAKSAGSSRAIVSRRGPGVQVEALPARGAACRQAMTWTWGGTPRSPGCRSGKARPWRPRRRSVPGTGADRLPLDHAVLRRGSGGCGPGIALGGFDHLGSAVQRGRSRPAQGRGAPAPVPVQSQRRIAVVGGAAGTRGRAACGERESPAGGARLGHATRGRLPMNPEDRRGREERVGGNHTPHDVVAVAVEVVEQARPAGRGLGEGPGLDEEVGLARRMRREVLAQVERRTGVLAGVRRSDAKKAFSTTSAFSRSRAGRSRGRGCGRRRGR